MKIQQYCKHGVIAISDEQDIGAAARLMREKHVGFLIVFREGDALHKPVGVLTDRDIVLQVTARDVDPHSITVGDVMTRQPLIANEGDELGDLVQAMRHSGLRRVPVVDARGALTGVIALDDVIDIIAGLMGEVAGSIKSGQRQEWHTRAS
ncbi:MAG TPA: CBS domain-containing protein [Povalibacter sp.]|uniref:CBS domain-containing protein n=1 Tax=Povalibacter sp. TaxID=1962978 RepID=UPI002C545781|nr:CBS domain-containing protein [Povalibacter sp.]HMN46360.1 CBS domain-containing protein [Povalibacter sp.]